MAFRNYILVCGGTACESSRSDQIYQNLIEECKAQGVADEVQVVKTGCFGFCEQGPIVKILPEDLLVKVAPGIPRSCQARMSSRAAKSPACSNTRVSRKSKLRTSSSTRSSPMYAPTAVFIDPRNRRIYRP